MVFLGWGTINVVKFVVDWRIFIIIIIFIFLLIWFFINNFDFLRIFFFNMFLSIVEIFFKLTVRKVDVFALDV
jgi:hypothetical protein